LLTALPGYGKGNVRSLTDSIIDVGNFLGAFPLSSHHFFPLGLGKQAKTETASASVRPTFILNDFIAVFIVIHFFYIRVAGKFMKQTISDTTDATVAMDQNLGENTNFVSLFFKFA